MAWYHCHEGIHECGGWHVGAIIMLVLLLVIVGLVVWGVMTLVKHSASASKSTGEQDALDIAKRRYARGDISKEQFDQIKKDLS
jgi:putative membrane protein